MKQKDLYGKDVEIENNSYVSKPNKIQKRWTVKEMGEFIAIQINKEEIPYVRMAYLDDFNKYSGQIVIPLVMDCSLGECYFEGGGRHLRSISAKVRGILKRIEKEYPVETYNWEPPESTYDEFGEFDGYDTDFIMFDYDMV
jgi:hypothetical protein